MTKIAVYNADNYITPQDALENGALYAQRSDWTYDNETGLADLLEVFDAVNQCLNGETDRSKMVIIPVIKDKGEWGHLEDSVVEKGASR